MAEKIIHIHDYKINIKEFQKLITKVLNIIKVLFTNSHASCTSSKYFFPAGSMEIESKLIQSMRHALRGK